MRLRDLIALDTSGWTPRPPQDDRLSWSLPDGGVLGAFLIDGAPEIPRAERIAELRSMERQHVNAQGTGLVEYTVVALPAGVHALRSIMKMPTDPSIDMTRSGLTYVAWLTVPFQRLSIVFKAQARETGPTGLREAAVLQKALTENRVSVPVAGQIVGWVPLPADGHGTLDANLAEGEEHDNDFPAHPLSRVRGAITRVQATLRLNDALIREPVFPLPAA